MNRKKEMMETKSWKDIKDSVYGVKGTERRDAFEGFKVGLLLRKAREDKHLTQGELAELVNRKREYISRIENNEQSYIKDSLRHCGEDEEVR